MNQKRKKGTRYFTQEHEDAIVNYALTDSLKIRTELYSKFIGPVFDQMVDKIVYTYKFTNLPNIESLKDECKVWLTTIFEKFEFWFLLNEEIDKWDNIKLKEKEQKVLNAIKILMESVDQIEIFNKKAIYLYMREITGLNTKQIVNNLNKIRSKYKQFKKDWENGKI